jgi:acetyl esterase
MSRQKIHPRWTPHIPAAQRMNDVLRKMGDLIPPLHSPELVAKARIVPEMYAQQELVVPVERRTIPGPGGELAVHIALPERVRGVVLDFHGGGFCLGWPHSKDGSNARLARDAEVAVVSVDYRLAPEFPFPAGPDDCYAAADWLVENAKREFGVESLFLAGDSAGGCLAALTAIHLREQGTIDRVAGLVLTYGIFDLSGTPSSRNRGDALVLSERATHEFHDLYLPGRSPEDLRDPAISPLYAELSGLPPAFLCAGTLDPLLDDSLFMTARLQAAGGTAEMHVIPESPHGFAAFPTTMSTELETLSADWVRARLDAVG